MLSFNTADAKCKVLHVGSTNPQHLYTLNNQILPSVTSEKDLGVYIESNLSWNENIQKAINKAKSCIAWVTRNVISRRIDVMLNIYKTLVRPHLEYCVQLWSPTPRRGNWGIIKDIENVQRMYTRLIDGVGLMPYEERLKKLNLTTLLERRARGDLIETFKIISGISRYGYDMFKMSRNGYNIIDTCHSKSNKSSDFFSRRVIRYWNKLSKHVKMATSVDSFKSRLEKYKITKMSDFDQSGNYWELSNEIFNRIDDGDRGEYVDFMIGNPHIAKRRNISIR